MPKTNPSQNTGGANATRPRTLQPNTTMQLLQTITPRGKRYFIDGRRTTREAYDITKFARRLECFQTIIKGTTVRHYVCAR